MERDHDRPRILVTCWRRPLSTYLGERTILDTLDPAYAGRVADADPGSYGAAPENVDDPDPGADEWELALIAAARERAVPTLAICRGAQLLAVVHGGRLAQRLSAGDGHASLATSPPRRSWRPGTASNSSPARGCGVRSAARSGSP